MLPHCVQVADQLLAEKPNYSFGSHRRMTDIVWMKGYQGNAKPTSHDDDTSIMETSQEKKIFRERASLWLQKKSKYCNSAGMEFLAFWCILFTHKGFRAVILRNMYCITGSGAVPTGCNDSLSSGQLKGWVLEGCPQQATTEIVLEALDEREETKHQTTTLAGPYIPCLGRWFRSKASYRSQCGHAIRASLCQHRSYSSIKYQNITVTGICEDGPFLNSNADQNQKLQNPKNWNFFF